MSQSPSAIPLRQWILPPALITLGITLFRLAGELLHWSPQFFSRASGGAGSIVGIVWLVPVLGVYFAMKLRGVGLHPGSLPRAFGFLLLAGLVPLTTIALGGLLKLGQLNLILVYVSMVAAILVVKAAWPDLARILWIYGLAARIPVLIVMLCAILGDWGTHFDAASGDVARLNPVVRWLMIGVLPQITFWLGFTVLVGMGTGLIAISITGRKASLP